jgi:predicted DCC family thiol-disulfide oxidoreductase YuxK
LTLAVVVVGVLAGLPRRSARVPEDVLTRGRRIVLFDGVCNLCNGFVDFLVRHDDTHRLRFTSLQSEIGQRVARTARPQAASPSLDTVYLVDPEGWIYERSDAALKITICLGGSFRLLALLWLIPRVFRDMVYGIISRWRYRIFGQRESCRIATPEEQALFI